VRTNEELPERKVVSPVYKTEINGTKEGQSDGRVEKAA
jgi:hypothetical protein